MKLIITLVLIVSFSTSFSQWTSVQQLPASNIFTLFHNDNFFYAGGTNVIYVSTNNGQAWDSTTAIPGLSPLRSIIDHIIVYKNELYASAPSKDIFKSTDGGTTWQNISAGIDSLASVTDFCEYKGDLYAATEGNLGSPIFKLDPVSRTHWLSFSNGLTGISTVVNSIVGNSNALIAGANNNSLIDYLTGNSTTWEERTLTNPPVVNEGVFEIITAHDTLFYAGKTGRFFISTDNGLSWDLIGNRLVTGATFIVNAKQALISSRYIFDQVNNVNTSLFYYIKKDSLQSPFVNFSVLAGHFTWKDDIVGDKLWAATDKGLYFMPLASLPGITNAEDAAPIILPVRFISFNAVCQLNKVVLTWKTAQEQHSLRFDIEKSVDGIHWTVIGSKSAAGDSNVEKMYSFTDNAPLKIDLYRIVEYDLDGRYYQTDKIQSSCNNATGMVSVWPNPVHDNLFIDIVADNASPATINIFDSKGALVKMQQAALLSGSNRLSTDMKLLANGVYHLYIHLKNGLIKKTTQVVKD